MRKLILTLAGMTVALALAMPSLAAEPRIGKYVRYDTGDFVIITSRSGSQAREFMRKLAMFRLSLEKVLGKRAARSGIGTHIVITSESDWDKYLRPRERIAGYFQRARFDNYMALNGDAGDYTIFVMFHEYTHFFLASQFAGEYPPWFNEGLAEVMAYAKFDGSRLILQIPGFRVMEARDRDWIPFERLIKVDHRSPEYQQHKLAESFYAQAWLTVHYGMIEDREFGGQIFQYLTQRNTLVPHEQAARNTFGADLAAVDEKLRTYSRNRRMSSGALELGELPEVVLPPPEPMSEADSLAALIDVMLVTRAAPERIRPLVDSLKRREATAARSYILAARLAELENESAAFDAAVEQAVKHLKDGDQEGRRELGTVLLSSATDFSNMNTRTTADTERDLKRAFQWFAEAVQRNPDDAKALWGLGAVLTRLNTDLDLADTALQAAYTRVPASADIAVALANLKHRQEKPEDAMRYLQDTIRYAGDLGLRSWATQSLQQTQDYIAERDRVDEENRKQREAYEKQLAEYEKKYGKVKKKK